ncbi:MAG: ABC transporter ATP-binding protein [Rubrobacter sp.]|nr:ATP-binding cassette domain-containing protein [Rubrobacteraceae bacterium]MDQ3437261.1 energy-coupling factor transporter ATPase [Actinomycetota bacterium]
MSLIEIEDLTFSYASQHEPALRNLSCSIEQGSFVGITGLAEAGKSSFCRLISGYIPHFFHGEFSGTVSVAGKDTKETTIGELAERVGFVFENPFDQLTGASLTVLEEAAFALENMGLAREEIRPRAEKSLSQVGMEDLTDRHPQQLSGGQSQRLALASVLAVQPEIFILDEPTSQLDPLGVEEVFDVISEMHRSGYTVIVVSQDLDHLAVHSDRLIVIDKGEIKWDGEPRKVLLQAAEARYPILIPDVLEISRKLRAAGRIPSSPPAPLTVEQAATELYSINTLGSAADAIATGKTSRHSKADSSKQLVFEDVHYDYPTGVSAIRGVSLSLDGGCVCIVGQNGAGKTTFAKHLNGLLRPTRGRVLVGGKDTREYRIAELAREVGLAFQNPDDQLFRSTVEEEVRFGPDNVGASPEEAKRLVTSAIDLMGLEAVREKKPHDLGLSERKRVATASVIAMNTPVVVLDEPTGGQDAEGIELLGHLVGHLVQQGKLVVVVTHDVKFAARHADRVIALHQGRVLLDDDPRTVFAREEALALTHVEPPAVTRLGKMLELDETLLSPEELLAVFARAEDS